MTIESVILASMIKAEAGIVSSLIKAGGGIISSYIQRGTAKQVARIQHNTAIDVALIKQKTALQELEAQREFHQKNRESQERIAELQRELEKRLIKYQECSQDKRHAKRIEHEEWVTYFQRETQRLMAWENLQVMQAKADADEIRQHYPLQTPQRIFLEKYARYYQTKAKIPPLVIFSPAALELEISTMPQMSQGLLLHAPRGFIRIEKMMESNLRTMLDTYQVSKQDERPICYQGIDWRDKSLSGETALSTLNYVLNSIPTIVVEAQFEGDEISYYLGWWDVMEDLQYQKMFSISWKEVLYPLARQYAREWGKIRSRKLSNLKSDDANLTSEKLQKLLIEEGGDDEFNFQILEREEEDKKHGHRSGHDYQYRVNDEKYAKELARFLNVYLCSVVGFAVDTYYLFNYGKCPIFPKLLPDILQPITNDTIYNNDFPKEFLEAISSNYMSLLKSLKFHLGVDDISKFSLSLAQGFTNLENRSFSQDFLNYSLQSFLRSKGIIQAEKENFFDNLESILNCVEDEDYMYDLNHYFKSINDIAMISKIDTLFEGWLAQKRNRNIARDQDGPSLYSLFV